MPRKTSNAERRLRAAIIQHLVQTRERKGISQADMAKTLGMLRGNLCKIEHSGGSEVSLSKLIEYASALGQTIQITMMELGDAESPPADKTDA